MRARLRRLTSILTAFAALGAPAAAQQIRGEVVLSDGATRAAGVVVVVSNLAGTSAGRALTNDRGEFELTVPNAGWYAVRLLRTGFRPTLLPNIVPIPPTSVIIRYSHHVISQQNLPFL